MQALQKLTANALFSRTSSLVNLQSATPAGSMSLTAIRGFADIKVRRQSDKHYQRFSSRFLQVDGMNAENCKGGYKLGYRWC